MKFTKFKDKDNIYRAGKKLKGSDFRIAEDFSAEVRAIRKQLGRFLGPAINAGKKASLRYDKLVIDSVTYVYDELSNDIKPCKR